jgi:uncharacterized protein YbjT (DUF2867 family)
LFLITGATGKTGAHTVRLLREQGLRVRAFVHALDDRADRLSEQGAEVVQGDLLDFPTVSAATVGVTAAYFNYPIRPGLIEATANFAQAASEAGVHAVVNMSQISARREATSNAARQHWIAERAVGSHGGCHHASATHLLYGMAELVLGSRGRRRHLPAALR